MQAQVSMGWDRTYTLTHAVLVYRAQDRAMATVHDTIESPDGGAPLLGPGRPVSITFLRELAQGLGSALPPEILPPEVLSRTPDQVVWWVPAATRPMFFDTADPTLSRISGRVFPHPPLVFKLEGRSLSVRALMCLERPSAHTALAIAPYWNTNDAGLVCQGSMRVPEQVSLTSLAGWVDGYFTSAFTHASGAVRLTRRPGGFAALWASLADDANAFPLEHLVPAKERLLDFVGGPR